MVSPKAEASGAQMEVTLLVDLLFETLDDQSPTVCESQGYDIWFKSFFAILNGQKIDS